MSIKRLFTWLLAIGLLNCAVHQVHAQRFTPFIEPGVFEHDMQFFAPAELGDFGKPPKPQPGWFGSLDRVYMYVSRPQAEVTYTEGDFTWGKRLDLGYMTEENHGWLMSYLNIDGPNAFDILEVERINRIFTQDDPINGTGEELEADQNNGTPQSRKRTYFLHDSVNSAEYSTFEISKIFRRKQLHHGGVLEPFFGFRYSKFTDLPRNDTYTRFDATGAPLPGPPGGTPLLTLPTTTGVIEELISESAKFDNYMVGGQLGARLNWWQGRWNLSTEVRAFGLHNFQIHRGINNTTTTLYDGGATDSAVVMVDRQRTFTDNHMDEFVFGADVRAQAAFEVTRDIALQFGLQFTEFGRGVGRGFVSNANDESVTMAGATFGIYVRR
ncbi:MAG: hypothetical protein ACI9HK_005942 [Pirellulaceae bacterium]|jgi:hypothetical protein